MLKNIRARREQNRQNRETNKLSGNERIALIAAKAARPAIEATAFDESLDYVADTYSPVGPAEEKKYLVTKTHRGPGSVKLFEDEGSPHAKSFVFSDGGTTSLYRREIGEVDGKRVLGVREYSITEHADERPSVTTEFHTRQDAMHMDITLREGQIVKEFQEDAGPLEPKQLEEVAWLEQKSGLLSAEQRYEMSLVGFALDAAGSHPDARRNSVPA